MGLLTDIQAHSRKSGLRCGVALLREMLEPDDLDQFDVAVANKAIPATAIANTLNDEPYTTKYKGAIVISDYSVQSHRRADCRCKRPEGVR